MNEAGFLYRVLEAHAVLPVLHVALGPFTACVSGPLAGLLAVELLRWPDLTTLYCPPEHAPAKTDRRIRVGAPPPGFCTVVCTSPQQPDSLAHLRYLSKNGVFCGSVDAKSAPAFYAAIRATKLFYTPWREHAPLPLYGCLIALEGKPQRKRNPPKAAKRLTTSFLPSLFTFGKDEIAVIFHANQQNLASVKSPS